jgi:hypothetical protein
MKFKLLLFLSLLFTLKVIAQSPLVVPSYIGKINQIKFSPDENYALYATTSGLKIFSVKDGKELRTLRLNAEKGYAEVTEIYFLKDGQQALVIGLSGYGYLDLTKYTFSKFVSVENGGTALLSTDESSLYYFKLSKYKEYSDDKEGLVLTKRDLKSNQDVQLTYFDKQSNSTKVVSVVEINKKTPKLSWGDESKTIISIDGCRYQLKPYKKLSCNQSQYQLPNNNELLVNNSSALEITYRKKTHKIDILEYIREENDPQGAYKEFRNLAKTNPELAEQEGLLKEQQTYSEVWKKKDFPKAYMGHKFNDYLSYDLKTKLAIFGNHEEFVVFNYETGEFGSIQKIKIPYTGDLYDFHNSASAISPSKNYIAVANNIFTLDGLQPTFKIYAGNTSKYNVNYACSEKNTSVLVGYDDFYKVLSDNKSSYYTSSSIKIDRSGETYGVYISKTPPIISPSGDLAAFSFDGGQYFYNRTGINDWNNNKKEYRKEQNGSAFIANSYSTKNNYVLLNTTNDGLKILKLNSNSETFVKKQDGSKLNSCSHAIWSENEKYVYIEDGVKGSPTIYAVEVETGKTVWQYKPKASIFNGTPFYITVNKSANQLLCFYYEVNKITQIKVELTAGKKISEKELKVTDGQFYYKTCLNEEAKYLVYCFGNKLHVYDANTLQEFSKIEIKTGVPTGVKFYGDEYHLLVQLDNSSLVLVDLKAKKELATIVFYENTDQWVAYDSEGRFDGSLDIFKKLYFTNNKNTIPLDAAFEQYYTPNLLGRLLNGEVFKPVPDITKIVGRPIAKIQYAEKTRNLFVEEDTPTFQNTSGVAEITIKATAPNDVIDEIRLFHNGKIVNLTTRNLLVANDEKEVTSTKKYTINLLNGTNSFRAVALNSQRTESLPDEINVVYNGNSNEQVGNTQGADGSIDKVDKSATLHLIVVGINVYQNKTMSLNYALADASAFKDQLEKDAKNMISKVNTYYISDKDATKKEIEKAFKQVQDKANAKDVFVFYYAGHGVINAKNKEFYLVPTDVSDLKNASAELESKGVPSSMLKQFAIDIKAQKQVFIIDACQSAGAFASMLTSNAEQQKNIAVVARATGTHWMAASGAQQFANEFSVLGHGAFTYVLLEALKGKAVVNNMVTVNALKKYLQKEVPVLLKKYSGTPQFPSSYGYGNDFPVYQVK